nr:hypothetical protein CFP56_52439 [Quercus suber]
MAPPSDEERTGWARSSRKTAALDMGRPSSQAPHLSAQFAKYKLGGNLEQAIAAAKQKIEFGVDDLVSSPDTMDPESPLAPMAGARTVAGAGPGTFAGEPGTATRPEQHSEIPESPQDPLAHLSPHTADSNPGLVSDHEDDDHGSGSEDDSPRSAQMAHSLGVRRECGAHDMDIDVAVDDDMDQHGVIVRRHSMLSAEARGLRDAGSPSRPLANKDP